MAVFIKVIYLTTHVRSFPEFINSKEKTLTTQIHANLHQERMDIFRYNAITRKWRLIEWGNVEDNPPI